MNTLLGSCDRRAIALSVLRTDYLRGPLGRAAHQEWFHFWISGSGLDVLVNFSVCHEASDELRAGRSQARVVVLVREVHAWDGDAENIPLADVTLSGGRVFARMADHLFHFDGGVFRLRGRLRRRPISFDLVLVPVSFPSLANNATLGAGMPPLNWLAVPRLLASGRVVVSGRSYAISNAVAYHDHNWGRFTRQDLAWQWGHATSSADSSGEPVSMVFARLLNPAQTEVYVQSLLLWRGPRQLRVLRNEELHVSASGNFGETPFTVPAAAALLLTDLCPYVPARFGFSAKAGGDEVACVFVPEAIARIAIPNPTDLGTTIIHETAGAFELGGTIHGESVMLRGTGVFEFLGRA